MAASVTIDDDEKIISEFDDLVNMGAASLAHWLESDESREVGWSEGGRGESIGHASGRRIVKILHKKRSDYTATDLAHMHEVVGYIKRHAAQRPKGDTSKTRWAYSLKNWGHDPAKA